MKKNRSAKKTPRITEVDLAKNTHIEPLGKLVRIMQNKNC